MKYPILIHDNCFKIIEQLKDKSIDLIITDPPYDVHVGASGGSIAKVKKVD